MKLWQQKKAFLKLYLRFLGIYVSSMVLGGMGSGSAIAAETENSIISSPFYHFEFKTLEGNPLSFSQFKGKLILLVNTASHCGFTGQYAGLERLWRRYRDRGLVIIAVPSNDFFQEPDSEQTIKAFCENTYKVTFFVTTKQSVIGEKAHPLFLWLKATLGDKSAPKWNFHKYLISDEGKPLTWFYSFTHPEDPKMVEMIEMHLPRQR